MIFKKPLKNAILLLILIFISGCNIYKPVDSRKVPVNVNDRAEKNIQEGRGFRLFDDDKKMVGFLSSLHPIQCGELPLNC